MSGTSTDQASGVQNEANPQVTLDEALNLARGHHESENFVLAERTYRDILRAVPGHFPTTQFLGVLMYQHGNYDEAERLLKMALESEPEDESCWNNYGGILTALKKYDEALDAYNKATEMKPDYLDALNNKAYTLWLLERYPEADEVCQQALEIAPNNVVTLNNLGMILAKRVRYEEACDAWEKASKIDAGDVMTWSNWGNVLRDMGKISAAQEKCEKALEIDPKSPEALSNLANCIRDFSDSERAIELYRKATDIKPEYYEAHNNMALAYIDDARFEEAAVAARYSVAFNNDFAEGYAALSKALCHMGEYDDAHRAAQRATHLDPENVSNYLALAEVLTAADYYDDAEAALQEALKREPNAPRAYMKLSEIQEKNGHYDAAFEAVDKAISISPEMPFVWLRKALLYYSIGVEVEEAIKLVDHALELNPKWRIGLTHKAEMLISQGRNEEAELVLREVLDSGKVWPPAFATLTSVKKFKSEDDPDFQAMMKLEKEIESYGYELASSFLFGLSEACEQLGKYDEAFEYLERANTLNRKSIPYVNWKDLDFHQLIKRRYTPAYLESNLGKTGIDSDAPVFIIGMPRSGTTLTEQIIASHPDAYGAGELSYVGDAHKAFLEEGQSDHAELAQIVLGHMKSRDESGKASRIVDKMPGNYMYLGFIMLMFPNAKIIHCRRNPIDTCLSCYKQNFARGQYWSYDLEELADAYQRYEELMGHWSSIFPDRFLEVDYEETVGNFEEQARKIIDHVGLEWNDACLEPHKQKRTILTASKAQVTKPVYKTSVDKWKRYEIELQPLVRRLLPDQAMSDAALKKAGAKAKKEQDSKEAEG